MLSDLLACDLSGDIVSKLENYAREIAKYEASSGKTFDDDVKVGVILRSLPEGGLKQHLILNIAKYTNSEQMINEIVDVRRAQQAAAAAPAPMAVDGLAKKVDGLAAAIGKFTNRFDP